MVRLFEFLVEGTVGTIVALIPMMAMWIVARRFDAKEKKEGQTTFSMMIENKMLDHINKK